MNGFVGRFSASGSLASNCCFSFFFAPILFNDNAETGRSLFLIFISGSTVFGFVISGSLSITGLLDFTSVSGVFSTFELLYIDVGDCSSASKISEGETGFTSTK